MAKKIVTVVNYVKINGEHIAFESLDLQKKQAFVTELTQSFMEIAGYELIPEKKANIHE